MKTDDDGAIDEEKQKKNQLISSRCYALLSL